MQCSARYTQRSFQRHAGLEPVSTGLATPLDAGSGSGMMLNEVSYTMLKSSTALHRRTTGTVESPVSFARSFFIQH